MTTQPQLSEGQLAEMRKIREKSDRFLERAAELSKGGLPAGGAHFDEFIRGESLAVFLRCLARGETAEAAAQTAKREAVASVKLWNSRHDYTVRRWEETAHTTIDFAFLTFSRVKDDYATAA